MLLGIYSVFMFTSLVLVGLGLFSKNSVLQISGYVLIFLLGLTVMPESSGSINYVNGSYEATLGNDTSIGYTYASYTSHGIGFYVMLVGVLGFISAFVDYRSGRGEG